MSYQHKQKGKIYVINRITTLAFRIPSTRPYPNNGDHSLFVYSECKCNYIIIIIISVSWTLPFTGLYTNGTTTPPPTTTVEPINGKLNN